MVRRRQPVGQRARLAVRARARLPGGRREQHAVQLGRALPRDLAAVRDGSARAAVRPARAEGLQGFQRRLAAELVAGHRELERLPDRVHPVAGAVRGIGRRRSSGEQSREAVQAGRGEILRVP